MRALEQQEMEVPINKLDLYKKINQAYEDMGFQLGWSLLYGPFENMWSPKYPVAFFGLNPGGSNFNEPSICNDRGSSYLYEDWDWGEGLAPLQQQVVSLYKTLAHSLSSDISHVDLLNGSMASNFIPFRSKNWRDLDNKLEALDFSRKLWKKRVSEVPCSLYITISKIVFSEIDSLLHETGHIESADYLSKKVGWGNVTYQVNEYVIDKRRVALLRLPHLSTYKIFSREQCFPAIEHISTIAKEYL